MRTLHYIGLVIVSACFLIMSSTLLAQSVEPDSTFEDTQTSLEASLNDSVDALYPLSPERAALLADYARFNNIWRYVSWFVPMLLFGFLAFSGLSARFRDWAGIAKKPFFILWLYVILLLAAYFVFSLPFDIYREYVVEHQYGFSNQTFMAWFGESLLSLIVMCIVAVVPIWFFYRMVNRARRWWLKFSIGIFPFLVFFIVIAPVFIAPLFNDFVSLEDKRLEKEIRTLAEESGIAGADIFQVNASKQSSKINAYVTGLLATKRIVLYDTLIKNFSLEEIKFVMGHEMGHYVEGHIWYGLAVATLLVGLAMWLVDKTIHRVISRFSHRLRFHSLGDIASLPLVILFAFVIFFFENPISAGASRYMEHRSDNFGMRSSGVSGEDAAVAFEKLSAFNLSDPDPDPFTEFWFYDHPSISKRIAYVRSYRQ